MSDIWVACPECATDREVAELEHGCCPFCSTQLIDIPKEPLPRTIQVPVLPKPKQVRTRQKKVQLAEPSQPTQEAAPEPKFKPLTQEERLASEEEAYRMPYDSPHGAMDSDIEKELASRVLCRRKLMPFIQRFRPKYKAGWVHQDICRRLEKFVQDVADGKEPRLLLMMPPRSGKSEIGSRHLPAWVLGKYPEWEIIAGSHTSSLTMSFSRYVRDLIRDPAYTAIFPAARLDPSSQSVENWNIVGGGGYLAAGVGTGITGRGAHILLLDDLVKDMEAADSPTIRENTWEWYCSTAYTRLAPGGGVLGIMCMTGDTPVLLADGTEQRLDTLTPGTQIATYARGTLAKTTVAAVKSSGRDLVYKITMSSGGVVRANQRHPFLTVAPSGEVSWTRLKHLTTAYKIVAVKGSGENTEVSHARLKGVSCLPSVEDFATVTMESRNGPLGTVLHLRTTNPGEMHGSSIGTESPLPSTTLCTPSKTVAVQSANAPLLKGSLQNTGKTNSQSITAMRQEELEDCSAMTATQESDILLMSQWHLPPRGISDFTLEKIVSIELDGEEEVFDVQVDHTENFIANGLVSHNTWWNEDDWAGRIQQVMDAGEGDKFEIIRYPAINDSGDEYILLKNPGQPIVQFKADDPTPIPDGARLTRPHNTAIHPERYTTEAMMRIRANLKAGGQIRVWNALYQQNPTPDSGTHFTKEMFRFYSSPPPRNEMYIYQAWDFAITELEQNDYTVGVTIGVDHRDWCYVLDMKRFKTADGILLAETVVEYAKEWQPAAIGVEDGQIWKSIKTSFDKACAEKHYWPSFEVLVPLTDKMVRAGPLKGRMQGGRVLFDELMSGYTEMKKELLFFPGGKHDDIVDALAWCVRLILSREPPKQVLPKQPKSWRDNLNQYAEGEMGISHMCS